MDLLEFSPLLNSPSSSYYVTSLQQQIDDVNSGSPSSSSQSTLSTEATEQDHGSKKKQSSTSEKKHPISCVRCRKLHKKCDKKLTGCSKCSNAGVDCEYKTPQKRGKGAELYAKNPTKKKKSESPPPPTVEKIQLEKRNILTPHAMIDIYFTFVCGIHPMIEKEKLRYFVNNCLSQFETNKKDELTLEDNIWIKSIGEMKCIYAMFLAFMVTGSQILADMDMFDKYLRKAELEIALLSLDYSTEFYWAVACHYVYIAYIGDGDFYKSNYYLAKVKFYIESQAESTHPMYNVLRTHSKIIATRFNNETFSLQTILNGTKNMFEYFTNKTIEEVFSPEAWNYLINTQISPQNYLLFKQACDFIFKAIGDFKYHAQKNLTDCHSNEYFKVQRLFTCVMTESFAFMFMKQIPDISFFVMEEIALKISLITEHELFPFLLMGTFNIVVEICVFHLGICRNIDLGLKPKMGTVNGPSRSVTFDYFSILEKDLKALKTLASRYRRVTKLYPNLISEMTEIIERNNMKSQTSPFLTFSEIPSPQHVPPEQDEILRLQLEQAFKRPEDVDSCLNDQSLLWEDLFSDVKV